MSRKKILIVTGRDYLYNYFTYNLSKREFECAQAATFTEIRSKAAEFVPDLVLIEHDLSLITELSTCKALIDSAVVEPPKYIIISHIATRELALKAANLGIDNFLILPCTLDDLMSKVDDLLGDENKLNVFRQGNNVVMALKGSLDHHFAGRFKQALEALATLTSVTLILDFSEVEFFAHPNLMPLLTARVRLEYQLVSIAIVGLNAKLEKMFAKGGLQKTFRYCRTRAEAMR